MLKYVDIEIIYLYMELSGYLYSHTHCENVDAVAIFFVDDQELSQEVQLKLFSHIIVICIYIYIMNDIMICNNCCHVFKKIVGTKTNEMSECTQIVWVATVAFLGEPGQFEQQLAHGNRKGSSHGKDLVC